MAINEISYEEYMKKLDEIERRYLSDEEDFPEGAREKGLEICRNFRGEVEEAGRESFLYFIDTLYGLPMHKPRPREE